MSARRLSVAFPVLVGASLLTGGPAAADLPVPPGFVVETLSPLFNRPVAMAFAPDGRIFVAEKKGTVWVIDPQGNLLPDKFINLREEVGDSGDRGMLGLALDPDFDTNRHVYLLFTVDAIPGEPNEPADSDTIGRLVRYTGTAASNGNIADLDSRVGLIGEDPSDGIPVCHTSHTIGNLQFGNDGTLFVSAGDGSHFEIIDSGGNDPGCLDQVGLDQDVGAFRAQYLGSMCGKVLRVDPATGHGLPDNPYWTGKGADNQSRVWAYGLRNPFRFAVKPGSPGPGTIYINDVGWGDFEEVNVARGGENFGWPCYEGTGPAPFYPDENPAHSGCDTIKTPQNPGPLTFPIVWWHHDDPLLSFPQGQRGFSACEGLFHVGNNYPWPYRNAYFYNDYVFSWVNVLHTNANDAFVALYPFSANAVGERMTDMQQHPITGDIHYTMFVGGRVKRIRYIAETVYPESFTVIGALQSGDAEDLHFSDDAYVVIEQRPAFTPLLPVIRLEANGTASTDQLSIFGYTMEASCSAIPPVVPQKLSIFNFQNGTWERLDERIATRTDSTAQVMVETNPGRFIEPGTLNVKARLEWFDPGTVISPRWSASIDEAVWMIIP